MLMKNSILQKSTLLLACAYFSTTVSAQITPERLQQFIVKNYFADNPINELYNQLNYSTAWIQKENAANFNILFTSIQSANNLGLEKKITASSIFINYKAALSI